MKKKPPSFPNILLEPWASNRVERIVVLEQSPTLTRAEVWINGEGYAFEEAGFMTAEEISIRTKKFMLEQKGS